MNYNYRPDTNNKLRMLPDWAWQVDMTSDNGLSIDGGLSEDGKWFTLHATYQPKDCPEFQQHFISEVTGEHGVLNSLDKIEKRICHWISTLPMWCQFTAHCMCKVETLRSLYMPFEDISAIEWIKWVEDNADIYELRQLAVKTKNQDDMDAKFVLAYMVNNGFESPNHDAWGVTRSMARWLRMKYLNEAVA